MRDPQDIKRATQKATSVAPNIPTNIIGSQFPSSLNFATYDTERIVKNSYRKNSLVASAIGFYQRMFAQAKFKVVNADNEKKPGNILLSELLAKPNPEQSESRFKINIITNLLTFASCFALIGRNNNYGGKATQIWCYNKGLMRPLYNEAGYLDKYEYYNPYRPGSRRKYEKEDIIHMLWPSMDPNNPNESISPIEQLLLPLETDNEIDRAVYSYLKNDMMRGNLLKMREGVKPPTEAEAKLAKEMWQEQTTGDSRGLPPWLTGVEDVVRLTGTFDELDSENIRKVAESRVASVFGIDAEVLGWLCGNRTSTFNNVKEKTKRFVTHTFAPMLDRIAEDLTLKLAPDFTGNNKITFDKAGIEAYREVMRDEADHQLNLYKEGTITLDEFRTHPSVGMETIPDGINTSRIRYTVEGAKDFRTFVKDYFMGIISDRNAAIAMAIETYGYDKPMAEKILPILTPRLSESGVEEDGQINPPINEPITGSNRL